jgi:hypothetical protein
VISDWRASSYLVGEALVAGSDSRTLVDHVVGCAGGLEADMYVWKTNH